MTVTIKPLDLANLNAVLDDVWDKPADFDVWWRENLDTVLELRMITKRMLRTLPDVEVEVA